MPIDKRWHVSQQKESRFAGIPTHYPISERVVEEVAGP